MVDSWTKPQSDSSRTNQTEVWVAAVLSGQRRNLQWARARLHAPSSGTGKQSHGARGGGRGHLIARVSTAMCLRARILSYRGVYNVVHGAFGYEKAFGTNPFCPSDTN